MTIDEINNILYNKTYIKYVNELKQKYGNVSKDYFYINKKGNYAKTQGITRGKDGLYIHHILESHFLCLSDTNLYTTQLEYYKDNENILKLLVYAQTADALCYCNLIEHLILHIKIALEYDRDQFEVGISLIAMDLTRFYMLGDENKVESTYSAPVHKWKCQSYYNIKDDYNIYVLLCKIGTVNLKLSPTIFLLDWYDTLYKKLFHDLYNSLTKNERELVFKKQ